MKKVTLSPAEKCWVGLGAYILLADALLVINDKETMSACFGRWLHTPRGKTVCAIVTGVLITHLFLSYRKQV